MCNHARAVRTLGIVIACLAVIYGSASGGPRRVAGSAAAAPRKPGAKPARPKPAKPTPARPAPAKPAPAKPAPADEPEAATATDEPAAPPARATRDARKTLEAVKLRKKPGEKQPVVGTLPAGTEILVEAEEGRWLRVRAGKLAGYVARTTVSDPAAPPPPPAPTAGDGVAGSTSEPAEPGDSARTRGWSRARRADPAQGSITELFVEVTAASAELRAEARPGAESVAKIARGARLAVVEVDDAAGWLRARDDTGHTGWIARADVGNGAAEVAASEAPAAEPDAPAAARAVRRSDAPAAASAAAPRTIAIRADAGIGYRTLGMDFQSNGEGGLANYLVTSGSGAAELELEVIARPSARWRFAADGRLQLSRLSPGLDYTGPTAPPGKIAFGTFGADLGVRAGRRMGPAALLWLRAGGHYDAFVVSDVENTGRLPRERLLGATAGARVDFAPPRSQVSASLWADALVVGSRRQTPGLEDGADSRARAVWAGATLRFRLRAHLSLVGAYDFGRATTRWSGMSVRQPGATEAKRTDQTQLVQFGLGAEM